MGVQSFLTQSKGGTKENLMLMRWGHWITTESGGGGNFIVAQLKSSKPPPPRLNQG